MYLNRSIDLVLATAPGRPPRGVGAESQGVEVMRSWGLLARLRGLLDEVCAPTLRGFDVGRKSKGT